MFHIVLYQPEIPPNTGNIIRLCVNAGASLHLIRPLGFTLDDARLRRAGLDYREWATVRAYGDLDEFLRSVAPERIYAFTTRGRRCYAEATFRPGDALLFGPETRGLPAALLEAVPEAQRLYLPMQPGSRSLNLSNAVALSLYEAWRQNGFAGAAEVSATAPSAR
ncbi:tRNA (cytidine(34)-2'-O)-methyltransferase [Candidatus Methylocalor cossyra]|uniref:tRNA (cytidine(34)-2'-O)-methyltransferase n=1 Tax=Candidatus Methylocalor cossyra TaxID=3108543 RepID=A0ABM9NKC8_9GAMM